jgi:adenylyltransferase/sulfurtransferase
MSYLARIAECSRSIIFSDEELSYYARHLLLPGIGMPGQKKLKAARVLIVGAGGLGCPVLQALAGAGVGRLTVLDGDTVALSNLARQWLHRHGDVGTNKAVSAQQKLVELNPFIEVEAVPGMLDAVNAKELIDGHDIVVDATDDLEIRYLIDEVCAELDRPWVHAALYRESAQLCVFWDRCGARFRNLFPERTEAPSCAGAGMLGAVASVAANLQALEVVKLITGNGVPKVGEVVSIHASRVQIESFRMRGVTAPPLIGDDAVLSAEHSWTVDALRQAQSIGEDLRIIDLRTESQFVAGTIPRAEHLSPEVILEEGLTNDGKRKVLLLCEEGIISSLLADALRSRGNDRVFHLEGGYTEWLSAG